MLWAATTPHPCTSGSDGKDHKNVSTKVAHVLVGSSKSWDELKLLGCIVSRFEGVCQPFNVFQGHAHVGMPKSAIAAGVTEEGNQDSKRAVLGVQNAAK
jgi:hypothetical protein